uniref:Uncharacterized protein n=1 Tax=Arundo donax TaxID=35708 RepID=A0A0A8ZTZ1_ARUDO
MRGPTWLHLIKKNMQKSLFFFWS